MDELENLHRVGLKATLPRMRVLEIIRSSPQRHLSADDVFRRLMDEKATVGLASVYRVLAQLEQAGILKRTTFEAGRAVFPRRGFHETRIDDVVEAAGASHGSFYRYFASKEDLFQAIAADAATRLLAGLQAFPADGGDAEALRTWLHGWFDLYAAHGGIIAIWRETQFPGHELEDLSRDVAKGALDVLLQAVGDRAVGDPLVDAMALLGLVETMPHHVHAFGYFSQATAVDALVVIIRRGFLAVR